MSRTNTHTNKVDYFCFTTADDRRDFIMLDLAYNQDKPYSYNCFMAAIYFDAEEVADNE